MSDLFDYYNSHLEEINQYLKQTPDPLFAHSSVSLETAMLYKGTPFEAFVWHIKVSSGEFIRRGIPKASVVFPPPNRVIPVLEFSEVLMERVRGWAAECSEGG